ncbi:MAG TPA: metallophosphoesterase [Microthrixaceae bacterium]|nr:metallophosphoesterase [Microthrixaceae bacterium]
MVRVLAIADEEAPALTPQRLRELEVDLVLGAGDLPFDYLEYVASAADRPVLFVPGNHDPAQPLPRLTRRGTWVNDGIPAWDLRPWGGRNVDTDVTVESGLRVAGLGGCVRYRPGPNQYDQRQFARRARRLLRRVRRSGGQVDVLLTHAPPAGLGDGDDAAHHGVEVLHDVLDKLQPTWHLHGHIHPFGHPTPDRRVGRTTVANVIPYRVLEIDPREDPDVQQRLTTR